MKKIDLTDALTQAISTCNRKASRETNPVMRFHVFVKENGRGFYITSNGNENDPGALYTARAGAETLDNHYSRHIAEGIIERGL